MNNLDFKTYINYLLLALILALLFDGFFIGKFIFKSIKNKKLKLAFKSKTLWLKFGFFILLNLIVPVLIGYGAYNKYEKKTPTIAKSVPSEEGVWSSYSDPLEIEFNVPVTTATLSPKISPDLKGRWEWEPYYGIGRLTSKGKFYPEESLFPNQRVVVYITGLRRAKHEEGHEAGFVFDSVKLPEVTVSNPFNQSKDVDLDTQIDLFLNKADEGLQDWKFEFMPKVEFDLKNTEDKKFTIVPKLPFNQSEKYTLYVSRQAKRINLATNEVLEQDNYEVVNQIAFETPKEPLVRSFSPKGTGVKQDAKIRIRFEVPIVKESAESMFKITPNVEGMFGWEDDRILNFTPSELLPKETAYKVSFAEGLKSQGGGVSAKEISFEFVTIGAIQLQSTSPTNGSSRINESTDIKVTFDQEVDQASAQSKFSISPNVGGNFRWEGNSMIFDPNGTLGFNSTYTVTLQPGIKSIYGIDSRDSFSFSFTVRTNQVVLTLPIFYQPQPSFACNIYATKMALAWKGYNLDPTAIIAEIGYNESRVNNQWAGNPNTEFVGNYNASWGYGVHWNPVKRLFDNRGLATTLNIGWNTRDLARAVENGNPVVIWRYNGVSGDYNLNWTATDGTYVTAINGQHGGVITGFRGTSDNPTQFQINDPWYGIIWMDAGVFDYYWSRLNRVGLVIY